jgi:zinc protease
MPNKSARALCGFAFLMMLTPLFASSAHSGAATDPGEGPYTSLRRFTLDNGCVVLILPSRKASTVAVYVAVRSGSADESRWMGMGLSHFVEHMFFKGTPGRDKGTLERQVREMGGYINAYTSHDNTVFYLTALSRHAEAAIDLMHDAAFHPLFDPEELEKERQVILAEQRMNEDRLARKALQSLWELAFLRHPYRHPIIGYPEIFKSSTRQDLMDYFKSRYTPNQMVVCVVGDIDPDLTEKWVRDRFGKEARAVDPPVLREPEPVQASPRKTVVRRPAQHARLELGYPGVPLTHPDAPALDVLAQILGDGASSRLFQQVKETSRLALDISASSTNLRDAGIIDIDALCLPKDIDAARDAILKVIEELKKTGPTREELLRARKQTLARHYSGWESHGSLAHDLVTSEIYTGDSRYSEQYIQLVGRVGAEDVLRVARLYLNPDRLNEVKLLPEAESVSGPQTAAAVPAHPKVQRLELSNGLKVLVLEDPSVPVLYAQVSFRGGVIEETPADNGASALAAELLLRGTRRLDQQALADQLADWGGDVSSFAGHHTFGFALSGLSEHRQELLGLMGEIITDSAFSADEWKKAHEDQLQSVLSEKEDIYNAAGIFLSAAVYGEHPYRQSSNGTEASLAKLTREKTLEFYRKRLAAPGMVVGVAGDVRAEDVRKVLERALGKVARQAPPAPPAAAPMPAFDRPVRLHEALKREQAVAMLAFRSVRVDDPRRYAFQVLNAVMNGSAGRLYQHIRGVHGMSYVINSGLQLGLDPGHFVFYAGVKPDEGDRVLELLAEEASKLRTGGVTEEELRQAKEQLIGNHEHAMESRASVLQEAVTDEILGLGFEEMDRFADGIRAVTKKDVEDIIREFIHPDRSVGLVVAPGPAAPAVETKRN